MLTLSDGLIFTAAVVSGGVASICGFGIGSILTPIFALTIDTRLAVAAVSIPHFIATFTRFWMLRRHVDRRVLLHFGMMSAAGGLTGAVFHSFITIQSLTMAFGAILIFSGIMGVGGWSNRLRFGRKTAWLAGAVSGGLGGLVGNQGGIRSAAMLGFDIPKVAFVATATAVGVMVDGARIPVYIATQWREMANVWEWIAIAIVGVQVGTVLGTVFLKRLPEAYFRRIVSGLILLLGIFMMYKAMR